jgi:ribosomal protein S18 acetylase RimI-like enzyme
VEPFPISGLLLRRAVLGTLLAAGGLGETPGSRRRADGYPSAMFTVEAATADDLDVLVEQGAALFREDAGTYDTFIDFSWSEREGRADFERLIANDDCLVLVARERATVVAHLVGYTHAASATRQPVTYANLRSLYVAPEHRRQGAADQLTTAFIEWARAKGCAEAHVDSYARNEPAQRLYERRGFVVRSTARALPL